MRLVRFFFFVFLCDETAAAVSRPAVPALPIILFFFRPELRDLDRPATYTSRVPNMDKKGIYGTCSACLAL